MGRTGGGDGTEWTSGNGSGAISTSSTKGDESSMEGADRKLGAAEDRGKWRKVTWRHKQRGGRKARARNQGGIRKQVGNGDGTNEAQQKYSDNRNGADEAQRHHTGDGYGADGETAPLQAATGAEHRCNRGAVRGRQRGMAEILRGAVTPTTMVTASDQPEQEGNPENPG